MINDKPTRLMVPTSPKVAMTIHKNKNWRANYLRALNICTPDLMTSMRRRHHGEGSQRLLSNGPAEPAPLRSHVFRTRKLTSKWDLVLAAQKVSAPIEIPTRNFMLVPTLRHERVAVDSCGQRHEYEHSTEHHKSMVQLLSWEEPGVMLGHGGWPLEIEQGGRNKSTKCCIKSWRSSRQEDRAHVEEDTEDEDVDGLENDKEEEDDDIFMMEVDSVSKVERSVVRGKRGSQDRYLSGPRMQCLSRNLTDDKASDVVTPLPASFVPPHLMVQRGCFSLGLRDKLKRRPVT